MSDETKAFQAWLDRTPGAKKELENVLSLLNEANVALKKHAAFGYGIPPPKEYPPEVLIFMRMSLLRLEDELSQLVYAVE